MPSSPEVCIDLDAAELLDGLPAPGQVKRDPSPDPTPCDRTAPPEGPAEELIELELTAEEMDRMLESGWEPRKPAGSR
ncbi:MAG: hypothetical protein DIU71_15675 [Proteobacteria bacterium]|nr:MAG: hypothetical protein DIU71_15675 [Pseudomonadota bacterium]